MENLIVTDGHLTRSLKAYAKYEPTLSIHLEQARAAWIPVVIDDPQEREAVRVAAQSILNGREYLAEYMAVSPANQLGVALCLMCAWSEILWLGTEEEDTVSYTYGAERWELSKGDAVKYTENVFNFLAYLPINWKAIAVRNWSSRDGGQVYWQDLFDKYNLTSVDVLMRVYVEIRDHWRRVGCKAGRAK